MSEGIPSAHWLWHHRGVHILREAKLSSLHEQNTKEGIDRNVKMNADEPHSPPRMESVLLFTHLRDLSSNTSFEANKCFVARLEHLYTESSKRCRMLESVYYTYVWSSLKACLLCYVTLLNELKLDIDSSLKWMTTYCPLRECKRVDSRGATELVS